jgi:hypothetical protein
VDASLDSGEPTDPAGPWVVDPARVGVEAAGQTVEVTAGLAARADEGPVDRVAVVDTDGRTLVVADCSGGACRLETPAGEREVPAATVRVDGAWHQGRAEGFALVTADGKVAVNATLFDGGGVRLAGEGLPAPIGVTGPLVLEGTPREVHRVALIGPGGDPVLVLEPGARGAGAVEVAGRRAHADAVRAELHGDPFRDDRVLLRYWVDGIRQGWYVDTTPAPAYQAAGEALEEHLVLRSPTAEGRAELDLAAGPVGLEDPEARLSPRFDVAARVTVEDAGGFERGWLTVDGTPVAELGATGRSDGARVLQGTLAADRVEPGAADVGARLERMLAPGVVQVREVDPIPVQLDAQGPPAPQAPPAADSAALAWSDREDVARWEAQVRPDGGTWRSVPVEGTRATVPEDWSTWEGRVRGVDEVGNTGPWSEAATGGSTGDEDGEDPPAPALEVRAPTPGARVAGEVAVRWAPDPGTAEVRVEATGAHGWRTVAQAREPPAVWDSRELPDGEHRLRVTASGPGGETARLVDVRVDNLDPVPANPSSGLAPSSEDAEDGTPPPAWQPGQPGPRALAAGVALALGGLTAVRVAGHGKR